MTDTTNSNLPRYPERIGQLIRNGKTVFYAYLGEHRDRLVESHDRDAVVAAIDRDEQAETAKAASYDTTSNLIAFEQGDLEEEDTVELFQNLINSGMAWKLQGSVGRQAMSLIESGDCILGEVGHKDYYGNYVPSRYEVQPGTKGSVEYSEKMKGGK